MGPLGRRRAFLRRPSLYSKPRDNLLPVPASFMRLLIKTLKDENLKKVQKNAPQYVTIRTAPQTLNKAFLRNLNVFLCFKLGPLGRRRAFLRRPSLYSKPRDNLLLPPPHL